METIRKKNLQDKMRNFVLRLVEIASRTTYDMITERLRNAEPVNAWIWTAFDRRLKLRPMSKFIPNTTF